MNTPALRRFRQKLADGEPVYGLWVTLESASITEMAVALGVDWVVIDAEHGHLDWHNILEHVRTCVRSETVILIRVVGLDQGIIKRVLDIGADGFLVPWIESADQLREAVRFAHYPLEGVRGIGGERATCWGQCLAQHVREADENVLVIPIIESVTGMAGLPEMLRVPEVEVFFFGPSDYSSSAGFAGQWEGPGVAEQILAAKDRIRAAGRHCGLISTGTADLQRRLEQGFRMIALGLDGGLLVRSLRRALAVVGRDRKLDSTLSPVNPTEPPCPRASSTAEVASPAVRPHAGVGSASVPGGFDLGPGVSFQPQLTPGDALSNLTTGIITVAPGAKLPYHRADFTEAVTLLAGSVIVEVEGRMYTLKPTESIVVPAGLAHCIVNRSTAAAATLHLAMATDAPARTPISDFFSRRAMPAEATGLPGAERIVRSEHDAGG